MTMSIRKFVIIVISVFVFKSSAFGGLSVSQIFNNYSPSVVTIISLDENGQPLSRGCGFFINASGDIATNHHLFAGAFKASVKTLEGKEGEIIEIIKDDTKLDLLVARTTLRNTIPLLLGDSDTIKVGEDIIGIGNHSGLEGAVLMGIISGVIKTEGIKLIQITAPISPGCSGGPVFDLTGEVIGIATAFLDLGHSFNLAMPVNYLKKIKPTRSKIGSLPKMTTKLEATVSQADLIEVIDINYGATGNGFKSTQYKDCNNESYARSVSPAGTVFFKNGKKLFCDRAWKDGSTIFLVVQGKNIAVGYDETEINIGKSFNYQILN